jgi:hypothetical protein
MFPDVAQHAFLTESSHCPLAIPFGSVALIWFGDRSQK